MIRVNLLEGAADTRAATRATKAVAKTTQQMLMVVGAVVLLLGALGFDYYYSNARLDEANRELQKQQEIAAQLKADRERKEQLEKQIASVKNRIAIIEDLEKTQKGPSAMLSLINAHMPPREDMVLDQISQKGENLTISGTARNEQVVGEFARGLEKNAGGLFQSVSIQTRQSSQQVPVDPADPANTETRAEIVYGFTLTTKYTPTQVGQPAEGQAAPEAAAAAGK